MAKQTTKERYGITELPEQDKLYGLVVKGLGPVARNLLVIRTSEWDSSFVQFRISSVGTKHGMTTTQEAHVIQMIKDMRFIGFKNVKVDPPMKRGGCYLIAFDVMANPSLQRINGRVQDVYRVREIMSLIETEIMKVSIIRVDLLEKRVAQHYEKLNDILWDAAFDRAISLGAIYTIDVQTEDKKGITTNKMAVYGYLKAVIEGKPPTDLYEALETGINDLFNDERERQAAAKRAIKALNKPKKKAKKKKARAPRASKKERVVATRERNIAHGVRASRYKGEKL